MSLIGGWLDQPERTLVCVDCTVIFKTRCRLTVKVRCPSCAVRRKAEWNKKRERERRAAKRSSAVAV